MQKAECKMPPATPAPDDSGLDNIESKRLALIEFYAVHEPSKIPHIDALLAAHSFEDIRGALLRKYGAHVGTPPRGWNQEKENRDSRPADASPYLDPRLARQAAAGDDEEESAVMGEITDELVNVKLQVAEYEETIRRLTKALHSKDEEHAAALANREEQHAAAMEAKDEELNRALRLKQQLITHRMRSHGSASTQVEDFEREIMEQEADTQGGTGDQDQSLKDQLIEQLRETHIFVMLFHVPRSLSWRLLSCLFYRQSTINIDE